MGRAEEAKGRRQEEEGRGKWEEAKEALGAIGRRFSSYYILARKKIFETKYLFCNFSQKNPSI